MELELTPNFVTVGQDQGSDQRKDQGQWVPRLVQEPPPPGLTDSEDSDDEVEDEDDDEDDEGHDGMQFFQMDNFLAGIHGVDGLLGHHQGPGGAWLLQQGIYRFGKFYVFVIVFNLTGGI